MYHTPCCPLYKHKIPPLMIHVVHQAFHCPDYLRNTFSGITHLTKEKKKDPDLRYMTYKFLSDTASVLQALNLSVCHSALSTVKPSNRSRFWNPASPACVCVCVCLLIVRQADTIHRWRDYHHGYKRRGRPHLQFPRQRLLMVAVS